MQARSGLPWRHTLALFGIGLAVYSLAARWIGSPGYMDADYYFATGIELRQGHGFEEPFLWNYLDDPAGLPHPSHLYWMPLPSLVAAAGMTMLGTGFKAAQLPFILMAAMLPPVVAQLSYRFSASRRHAWQAGLLAAFPGFYLPFMVTTDSFAIYALVGSLALWTMAVATQRASSRLWLLAGVLVGWAYLSRADAPLLLVVGLGWIAFNGDRRLVSAGALLLGFVALMSPWWLRNWSTTGSILNPGSAHLFWMVSYDDLFSFPASILTFDRWQMAGLGAALSARVAALGTNLQRLIAEDGLIYLGPLALLGAWRWRRHTLVRLLGIYLVLLLAAMTLIYPFVGARGGLFHSGSALLPGVWLLAPVGLEHATHLVGRRRGWNLPDANRVFGVAAVALAIALTVGLFYLRQIRPAQRGQGWNASARTYEQAAALLPDEAPLVVAVNNPPGFSYASGAWSIVIPNGGPKTLQAVVTRYQAGWVVLEANHPDGLAGLYQQPDSVDWLDLWADFEDPYGRPVYLLQVARR